jgi:hypothetical protein
LVSRPYVIVFPETGIFGIAIAVLIILRQSNITAIGGLITSIGGYFCAYIIYAKGKFDLFYKFASTLGGYDKKEGRL